MNQENQPEALRLADWCEANSSGAYRPSSQAASELRRQYFALNEWFEKTQWVQKAVQPRELGMHRADILRTRIESLQAELVAEAARTAEEKLRAEQMTEQHRMQCNISKSAVATLVGLGYTDRGGEQWAPPIGKAPDFNLLDAANARIADLEAQLSAIGAGGVEPEFFTVFASHNGGKIALPGYSNETEKGVKDLVLQAARQEGYKGTVAGRLLELGWWIGPVFASSADAAAAPAPVGVAVPETWAIYDSQGIYETRNTAAECKQFCDHYNARDTKLGGGLEPYTYKALYAAAPAQAVAVPRQIGKIKRGEDGHPRAWLDTAFDGEGNGWADGTPIYAAPAQEHATQLAGQGLRQGVWLKPARAGRVYVAGPMTGLPEFNFPAFNAKAAELRANGWHVENPAEHGHVEGAEWADYLHYDIGRMATCSTIHLLPGWCQSRGAALEVHVASVLGMEFQYAEGAEIYHAPAQAHKDEQA